MNDALPYLPCLKHKEGAPTAMNAMNIKYTEIEIFTIVLNVVNLRTSTVFYASVQEQISYRYYKVDFTVDQGLQP